MTGLSGHLCSVQYLTITSSATGCSLFARMAEWPVGSARVELLDQGPRAFMVVTLLPSAPKEPTHCTLPAVLRKRLLTVPSPAQCAGFSICHPPRNWFYWRAPDLSGRKGSVAALTWASPRSGPLASRGAVHPGGPRAGAHCCRATRPCSGVASACGGTA